MSQALHRAVQLMTAEDLPSMVLSHRDLPASLQDFIPRRQNYLDNHTMAENGMPGSSAERFREVGRITGYLQEFNAPVPENNVIPPGYDVQAASVVHLFDDPNGVARWIDEVFLHDFEANVNEEIHPDQHLLAAERLPLEGFSDVSAGLRVVHGTPKGTASSTVVDFRVGRILGVVYVVTLGNYTRLEVTQELGLALERKIVRVVLGDL
ncbi:hypothetical protein [Candidatus Entotheonella palauensis]|uniref:hypothetical protein n=1 Tax=Candidatus Entotheonella palauensis TaxID=93172 RepID=UPI000B800B38|nr:hypothetical protein [Candidatus Entotheonella palauensis]